MIQFPRPPSKLGSENPKKSYLGKLKIVPRFEFLLECGVIHMSACLSVFMSWISDEFGSSIVIPRNGLKIFKNGKKLFQNEEKSGWPNKIRGLGFDFSKKIWWHHYIWRPYFINLSRTMSFILFFDALW